VLYHIFSAIYYCAIYIIFNKYLKIIIQVYNQNSFKYVLIFIKLHVDTKMLPQDNSILIKVIYYSVTINTGMKPTLHVLFSTQIVTLREIKLN